MISDQLTELHKSAIADVAIAGAELESSLEWFIADLCGLNPAHAAILLGNVRLDAKLNTPQQIVESDPPSTAGQERLAFAIANLKNLNAQRNTIIHGQWMPQSWPPSFASPKRIAEDIRNNNLVAFTRKHGKPPRTVSASKIRKVAELTVLNHELLTYLLCEYFPERVIRMVGVAGSPKSESIRLQEKIRKRSQNPQ